MLSKTSKYDRCQIQPLLQAIIYQKLNLGSNLAEPQTQFCALSCLYHLKQLHDAEKKE